MDEAQLAEATTIFRELNLDQASAQKLVDYHTAKLAEVAGSGIAEYQAQRKEWQSAVLKDPELGTGTSVKPEVRQTIARAFDSLGDKALVDEFKSVMDRTGAGDSPAFVKLLYRLAKDRAEGTAVRGANPAVVAKPDSKPRTAASALYPNLP